MFESVDRARSAHYKLTSTMILHLSTSSDTLGDMDLSGNMTRQIEQDMPISDDSSHVVNVGKLVEDMELKMRNLLRMISLFERVLMSPLNVAQKKYTLGRQKTWSETYAVSLSDSNL